MGRFFQSLLGCSVRRGPSTLLNADSGANKLFLICNPKTTLRGNCTPLLQDQRKCSSFTDKFTAEAVILETLRKNSTASLPHEKQWRRNFDNGIFACTSIGQTRPNGNAVPDKINHRQVVIATQNYNNSVLGGHT